MYVILFTIVYACLFPGATSFLTVPAIRARPKFYSLHANSDAPQHLIRTEPAIQDNEKYMDQKNLILLEKFISPATGNLTETANEYVNFCDESFSAFLNDRISHCESKTGKVALGRIRYELNVARQRKLIQADRILRGILKSGGILEMETKLRQHLRKAEIDMAFMVILQLNIEDAANSNAQKAVEVMTRLGQIISEYQDTLVSAPVRLMRLLVRTEDPGVRKQMLRQKLILAPPPTQHRSAGQGALRPPVQPVYSAVASSILQAWGSADVTVPELEDTIRDVLMQVRF